MIIDNIFRIGRAQYGPGASLGPRNTIGYEFVRVLQGQVTWTYDECKYKVDKGDWILSQPQHREHYLWDKQGETKHDHIHFTLTDLPTSFPRQENWPTVCDVGAGNIMQALFEQIIQLHKSSHPQRTEMMKITVQQMLYFWVYQAYEIEEQDLDFFSKPVQRVIDAVQMRWLNGNIKSLSTSEMINISCISRSSFLRMFQQECKDTPSRFFEKSRLYLGRLHLIKSNRNIDIIADLLGYSSPFHFSKNFKQQFGYAPRDFRYKLQQDNIENNEFAFQKVFTLLSATQTL